MKKKDYLNLLDPKFIATFIIITLAFFFLRLYQQNLIPVFVDEAIYIRWAQIIRAEPTLRFVPLSDGKQPLFMWLMVPFLKFIKDPLIAGRSTSALSGYFGLLGLGSLTYYLTKSKVTTLVAIALITVSPFNLFFDRLSLVDSLLSTFGVWSLFLGLLHAKNPRLDLSLLLGFLLGGALITKSPGILFVLLQPVLLLTREKTNKLDLLKIVGGWIAAGSLAFLIFNILRLGPNFHLLTSRNYDYVFPVNEVFVHPLNPLIGNLKSTFTWYLSFFTWPIFAAGLLALGLKDYRKITIPLFLWILLPILFQASIAKVYTSRYILYTTPAFILLASLLIIHGFPKLHHKATIPLIAFTLIIPLLKDYQLLTTPSEVRLPQNEKHGYFQEWTAGYGQQEIATYIKERAKNNKVLVGTEGFFGTLPDGLQIYLEKYPNTTVIGVGLPIIKVPDSLTNALVDNEVYLVVNKSRNSLTADQLVRLELIEEYPKPQRPDGTREVLQFYHLLK